MKAETGVLAGTRTLLYKEVLRFWKVSFQTVAAPVLTAVLYLLIFGHVLEGRITVFGSVGYTSFLIPGLVMMSVLQNAFANSSSSLIQSKITGNLVFLLVSPLSHWAWFLAYVGASIVRGVAVGLGVLVVTIWFAPLHVANPLWIVFFTVAGAALMGALGLIAGLWAEKFDQIAAFQNFIIMPMTFLSGVFYSVQSLPPVWREVSHLNPFFYMIDGFRHGFFGTSDVSPWISLGDRLGQPRGGVRDLPAPASHRLQDPPLNSRATTAGKAACRRPAAAPTAAVAASGDSAAVLGLRACRITRFVHFVHCDQTDAASQKCRRAARAGSKPCAPRRRRVAPPASRTRLCLGDQRRECTQAIRVSARSGAPGALLKRPSREAPAGNGTPVGPIRLPEL